MSKRKQLYRSKRREAVDITTSAILAQHSRRVLGKHSGKVCSLPMRVEKAQRLANRLHTAKALF